MHNTEKIKVSFFFKRKDYLEEKILSSSKHNADLINKNTHMKYMLSPHVF